MEGVSRVATPNPTLCCLSGLPPPPPPPLVFFSTWQLFLHDNCPLEYFGHNTEVRRRKRRRRKLMPHPQLSLIEQLPLIWQTYRDWGRKVAVVSLPTTAHSGNNTLELRHYSEEGPRSPTSNIPASAGDFYGLSTRPGPQGSPGQWHYSHSGQKSSQGLCVDGHGIKLQWPVSSPSSSLVDIVGLRW